MKRLFILRRCANIARLSGCLIDVPEIFPNWYQSGLSRYRIPFFQRSIFYDQIVIDEYLKSEGIMLLTVLNPILNLIMEEEKN